MTRPSRERRRPSNNEDSSFLRRRDERSQYDQLPVGEGSEQPAADRDGLTRPSSSSSSSSSSPFEMDRRSLFRTGPTGVGGGLDTGGSDDSSSDPPHPDESGGGGRHEALQGDRPSHHVSDDPTRRHQIVASEAHGQNPIHGGAKGSGTTPTTATVGGGIDTPLPMGGGEVLPTAPPVDRSRFRVHNLASVRRSSDSARRGGVTTNKDVTGNVGQHDTRIVADVTDLLELEQDAGSVESSTRIYGTPSGDDDDDATEDLLGINGGGAAAASSRRIAPSRSQRPEVPTCAASSGTTTDVVGAQLQAQAQTQQDLLGIGCEPVTTSSGLLLTHRQAPGCGYDRSKSNAPRSTFSATSGRQQAQERQHGTQPRGIGSRPSHHPLDGHPPPQPNPDPRHHHREVDRASNSSTNDLVRPSIPTLRVPSILNGLARNVLEVEDCSSSAGVSQWRRRVPRGGGAGSGPDRRGGGSLFSSSPFSSRSYGTAPVDGDGGGNRDDDDDDDESCGGMMFKGHRTTTTTTTTTRPPSACSLLPPYVRVWLTAFFALLVAGTGIACAAVRHSRATRARHEARAGAAGAAGAAVGAASSRRRRDLAEWRQPMHGTSEGEVFHPKIITASTLGSGRASTAEETFHPEIITESSLGRGSSTEEGKFHPLVITASTLGQHHRRNEEVTTHRHPALLEELRETFDAWTRHHRRDYGTEDERERRFGIWADNHHRIGHLNERHGPCRVTGGAVFGSNHLQDLTPEEFKSTFLTGYNAKPHQHEPPAPHQRHGDKKKKKEGREGGQGHKHRHGRKRGEAPVMKTVDDPLRGVKRHPSVQKKYEEHWEKQQQRKQQQVAVTDADADADADDGSGRRMQQAKRRDGRPRKGGYQSLSIGSCWTICSLSPSCWFNCLLGYSLGGTMTPTSGSNPSSMDWRNLGVVTSVHSQGTCGACWAITAVETVESAYAISSGNLYQLMDSEVIACDDSCQMCNGGWPQNAYEYIMEHGGLPLEGSNGYSYDGDYLMSITQVEAGESDALSEEDISTYRSGICSASQSGGSQKSGDNDQNYNYDNSNVQRYGSIKGYGYATDKCVCYTNGSGCDCDSQNEGLAIRNVASYGPATVCIDAEVWQYYSGGIMTSSSGCSAAFLDMNHCVQTVGYIFTDEDEDGEYEMDYDQSGSGSGSNKSNKSGDSSERTGYWIVRNQWSSAWGYAGYAYVSMGENTCGILNDMTQAYMKN